MEKPSGPISTSRRIVALLATVLLIVIVWKFIDYRMRPPPPPPSPTPGFAH